ncbi:transcriptional regulator [Methylobacterium oxalidis]|uniref:Transcriptional regulator n=1 Tax=Methylobacterium oxalidis TaxID=944322 RepID=A0A512JCP6_9HYPH|nr:transcriptional regulator [Methylobacterium oxalidis]GEP07716.1 transcriptional regulator [Methylobacterium oxalidis]GLS66499.1 transcriptional regulator [Methylobacterium oxalidis]
MGSIKVDPAQRVQLTGAQIRAARALLRWSAEELASAAQLGVATIRRAEAKDGPVSATPVNVQAIRSALERAGIDFLPENGAGAGVRFRAKHSRSSELPT